MTDWSEAVKSADGVSLQAFSVGLLFLGGLRRVLRVGKKRDKELLSSRQPSPVR